MKSVFSTIVLFFAVFLFVVQGSHSGSSSDSDSDSSSSSSSSNGHSNSVSHSGSDSSDDDDCGCDSEIAALSSRLSKFEDRYLIEQLIFQLAYRFDNFANDIEPVSDYTNWLIDNAVPDLVTIVGDLFTFTTVDEFVTIVTQLDAANTYFNHFIMPGGLWFVELTDNFALVRQHQLIEGIQLDFTDFEYKQDNTWELIFFELEKINGDWKFTKINSAITFEPCEVGTPYDTTNEVCL